MRRFQLAVIGTGTAASTAAMQVRDAGWSVAVIDARPFGGTCALRGCDPKKVLIGAAALVDAARRQRDKGVAGDVRLDWARLMAFKRDFTDPVPERMQKAFDEKGIASLRGRARFTGPRTLDVDGEVVEAEHILIASGAEPARLGIAGEEHLVTSERFMELESLPQRILLVGGGYIAAEFSHLAAVAGASVTILQHGPRMLKGFDAEVVDWLMRAFEAHGVDVHTGTAVEAIEAGSRGWRVAARTANRMVEFEADLVVHAAGRVPALDGLALDAGGVAVKDGRLQLDGLQSVSNPAVWAAGDAAQAGPPLTPVSSHDARAVAASLLEGRRHDPDYRGVPSVVFTIPPLAKVGLTEQEARDQGLKFRKQSREASQWFTARQSAQPTYGFKVLVGENDGTILGAHLVGPHAEQTVNLFALAMRHGLKADALRQTLFAYPTPASDITHML